MRDKLAEIEVLKRIVSSHKETIKIPQQDATKLMEERDDLVEDKANLIHDLLEVKDVKAKLKMDVNHLESEARELLALNIANIISDVDISDVQKDEKLRKIEDIICS